MPQTPKCDSLTDFVSEFLDTVERIGSIHFPRTYDELVRCVELIALIDTSVSDPRLGPIFGPDGPHAEESALWAETIGARYCFPVTGGTTQANHSAMWAIAREGDRVAVPRNAHRSIYDSLVDTGATPIFMETPVDLERGIAGTVTTDAVRQALDEGADSMVVTDPTYCGVRAPLADLVKLVTSHDVPLFVDAAWDALRLLLAGRLGESAVRAGADLVTCSLHKCGLALSQGSLVCTGSDRYSRDLMITHLERYQSTSPSRPIIVSMALGFEPFAEAPDEIAAYILELAARLRKQVQRIRGLDVLDEELLLSDEWSLDPTKVVIDVSGINLSGTDAADYLRRLGHCVEYYGSRHVSLLVGVGATPQWVDSAVESLSRLADEARGDVPPATPQLPPFPPMEMTPRTAFLRAHEWVPLTKSQGRIAAASLMPYPPGIPVAVPGEQITREVIDYTLEAARLGIRMVGLGDPPDLNVPVVV